MMAMSSGDVIPEPRDQKKLIRPLLHQELRKDDIWYLIEQRWFRQWKDYVGLKEPPTETSVSETSASTETSLVGADECYKGTVGEKSAYPGPIDNRPLFEEDYRGADGVGGGGSSEESSPEEVTGNDNDDVSNGSGNLINGCSNGDDNNDDGADLVCVNPRIREKLVDDMDYTLVPAEAWNLLVLWYGTVDDKQVIRRKVIEHGMFVKSLRVEVYLTRLELCEFTNMEKTVTRYFSKAQTVDVVEKIMRNMFNIPDNRECRLYSKYLSSTFDPIQKGQAIMDAGLYDGAIVTIERQNDDGTTWPYNKKSRSNYSTYGSGSGNPPLYTSSNSAAAGGSPAATSSQRVTRATADSHTPAATAAGTSDAIALGFTGSSGGYAPTTRPGLCGLANLGNSCFMNSAIQCLSNVPLLTAYFLHDKYKEDINVNNPMGMKGQIAQEFASLMKSMWSGHNSYYVPRNLKVAVGRFAPQFTGYQQHDSQELMAFLLDGLHEDCNRIRNKPYIELKDGGGRPDEVVAKEAWYNHQQRNHSIVVDIFHGQLKSRLVCPDCSKISVTFDPFCYLSVPLPPVKKEKLVGLFYVPFDSSRKIVQYKLLVFQSGTVRELCEALEKHVKVPPTRMIVADVYNKRFHKLFRLHDSVSVISERDEIFVYEVPIDVHGSGGAGMDQSGVSDPSQELIALPVYNRELRRGRSGGGGGGMSVGSSSSSSSGQYQLFGEPLVVVVKRDACTYDMLYNLVIKRMERYVRVPADDDPWWTEGALGPQPATTSTTPIPTPNTYTADMECDGGEVSSTTSDTPDQHAPATTTTPPAPTPPRPHKKRLFKIRSVNSYGNSVLDDLVDDGQPLTLSGSAYLSCDWHYLSKARWYREEAGADIDVDETVSARYQAKRVCVSLHNCIQLFMTEEKLGANDLWYCPACKEHKQATKKFDLWSLPRVLIIHLKRFQYNRYWRDKIDTLVDFPINELDMSPYIINTDHGPASYNLIGVSNHYGGLGGGHYTACCKSDHINDTWHYFDDNRVSECTAESAVSKAAYVLLYERCDVPQIDPTVAAMSSVISNGGFSTRANESGITNGSGASSAENMDTN